MNSNENKIISVSQLLSICKRSKEVNELVMVDRDVILSYHSSIIIII